MSNGSEIDGDPTGRTVCSFEDAGRAAAARASLIEYGFPAGEISILDGSSDADEIDASAKWFADTAQDLKRYQRELELGNTVLSVPAVDEESLQVLRKHFEKHDGRMMTHFGDWVTRTEEL